ncbi:MAG: PadR family transcriptional regulator [Bryobacteraceae bacterium]|nr:PadR family transcriptional regulator [Bryobacteraceae bacterium]
MLGEFEYLLIAAAVKLGDDAYGATIKQEIERATGGRCSLGALYTTLDRLEEKGLIRTRMGGATPRRGGRSRRMVQVTRRGMQAAAGFYEAVASVSRGVAWAVNRAEELS